MPRVPQLFIDKLAITIPLEGTRGEQVHQTVRDQTERWCDFISLASFRNRGYRGQYRFALENDHSAALLLEPRNQRNNYFKLEYSPNNFGDDGRALLGEYLRDILGDGYLTDIRNARLTRLDVAFDVRRMRLKDLMIIDLRNRKSSIIRGRQGEAESYYFPFKGTNQLCVYDKLQEQIDINGPLLANRKPAEWIRFEYRYRRLNGYTLGDVVGRMQNPFADNFDVRQFGTTEAQLDAERLRMFFDACRLAGVESILEEIPELHMKDSYRLAYRTFPVPYFWQRRTSIWAGFRAAIENALPV